MDPNEEKKDQYSGPTMGVFSPHAAAQSAADQPSVDETTETAENQKGKPEDFDDVGSQQAIYDQIYAELHTRAQHLMDFVYEHRLTRAQLLVALKDR
jgi:hypothetical protein